MIISIPGSKSYTNRALVMAALTKGAVTLYNPLYSDDTEAMIGCLRTLGIRVETGPDRLVVHDDISGIPEGEYTLFVHDSGTTARFMLALLCLVPGIKTIQGSRRLNARPIHDLVEALRALGAQLEYGGREGELPIKIVSSGLSGNSVALQGDVSSQFCSALLLIAPSLPQGLTIDLVGPPISKPYIDMTVSCMQEGGVRVAAHKGGYAVPAEQSYSLKQMVIEGDYSSASYFFAAAALNQSTLTVENLNPTSLQADRKFLAILEQMGNDVTYGNNRVTLCGKRLQALEINMEECPDQVMTLAVLAAFAPGVTHISGVRSLRVKECERVAAMKNELAKMGIKSVDTHDTLTVYGGAPHAAEIETYGDHRIAMAFAVAGTHVPGMVIRRREVVNKTFPTFWEVLGGLR